MRHFTFPLFFSLFLYVCVLLCVCDFPLCKEIIPNNQEKHKRHPGIPTHPHWPQSTAKCITNSIIKYVLGTLGFQLQPSNAKKKRKRKTIFIRICVPLCMLSQANFPPGGNIRKWKRKNSRTSPNYIRGKF